MYWLVVSLCGFLLGCWLLPRKRAARWLVAFLGAVLAVASVVHILSVKLSGSGFNEAVLYHLLVGIEGAGLREYTSSMLLAAVLLVVSSLYAVCCFRLLRQPQKRRWLAVLAVIGLLSAFVINPGITGTVNTSMMYLANEPVVALPEDLIYAKTTDLRKDVVKPKNLVLIYAESLEAGYLDSEQFQGLAPNLTALREESLSFSQVKSLPGMTWTIGGMVASQCGIPLVTASNTKNAQGSRRDFLPEAYELLSNLVYGIRPRSCLIDPVLVRRP